MLAPIDYIRVLELMDGKTPQAEIARESGISDGAVAVVCSKLERWGLAVEVGNRYTATGAPPDPGEINRLCTFGR